MTLVVRSRRSSAPLLAAVVLTTACSHSASSMASAPSPAANMSAAAPSPDPRVGLRAGAMDAQEATWNLHVLSSTQPSAKFVGQTNSDLAFTGPYAIQGSYAGYQILGHFESGAPVAQDRLLLPGLTERRFGLQESPLRVG